MLTRLLLCVPRMFALIRQTQQLVCPGRPADSDWDGEIDVSVSRPFRVRAGFKFGLPAARLCSHKFRPRRPHCFCACDAAEQYNLESYFPAGKQGSTSMDVNQKNYIDATLGNYPNKW